MARLSWHAQREKVPVRSMKPILFEEIETLAHEAAAHAEEIDVARALPDQLVANLKEAGLFRALIPQAFGGLEADFAEYVAMIQRLANADASTAWCVNQAAVIGLTSMWLPEQKIKEIWSTADTSVANGPPFDCHISRDGEGYRLSGHWGFSSGCQHAVWMMGVAKFAEGGYRIGYFRPSDVEFMDTWQVAGLRGTGSFEFKIEDLYLAEDAVGDLAAAPTYDCVHTRVPNTLLFATSFAGVALGVAEAAMQDVVDIAQGKVPRFSAQAVRDDPDVQRFLGRATATFRGAQAYLYSTIREVTDAVGQRGEITHEERGALRLAGTHVIQTCAEVVDTAYKISGSTGIYQDHTLQRRFQDMHVITQHVQGRETYFAAMGRYLLSGEYELGPMM